LSRIAFTSPSQDHGPHTAIAIDARRSRRKRLAVPLMTQRVARLRPVDRQRDDRTIRFKQ
jgi:hypothetical protein